MRMRSLAVVVPLALALASGHAAAEETPTVAPATKIVTRAREEVSRGVDYDSRWFPIKYPGGDVAPTLGVCTDVVVRSYRAAGIDFQPLLHADVVAAPQAYDPWVKTPDSNIDHRRVGPLMIYLNRHATKLSITDASSYKAGDIVVISFGTCPSCSPQHIGVVSDKMGSHGLPLMIHNMGPHPSEDDTIDAWTRLGHYRVLK